MHRVIEQLRWAAPATRPRFAGVPRKGAKRRGILFEKSIAEALSRTAGGSSWKKGPWFQFEDARGHGWCQPDFVLELAEQVLVLEAKLTWVPEGHTQLELLYRPIIEMIYKKPMVGLVVAKRLTSGVDAAIAQDLRSARTAAAAGRRVVLHWSCKQPLAAAAA